MRCTHSCETRSFRSLNTPLCCWVRQYHLLGDARDAHSIRNARGSCCVSPSKSNLSSDPVRPITASIDARVIHAALQTRPVHLPLLVSVVGLSLRPVFLGVPRTDEVDQCRIRFCTSVACVPKLVESVPSAMLSMFRRPRLWRALLPVLATATSTSGLPVVECVPPRSHLVLTMLQLTNTLLYAAPLARTRIPALLGNLIDLAAPLLDGQSRACDRKQLLDHTRC